MGKLFITLKANTDAEIGIIIRKMVENQIVDLSGCEIDYAET